MKQVILSDKACRTGKFIAKSMRPPEGREDPMLKEQPKPKMRSLGCTNLEHGPGEKSHAQRIP